MMAIAGGSTASLLAVLCSTLSPGPGDPEVVRFTDASLEPDAVILETEFVDVDLDGQLEVCLAVLTRDGRRELRLYRLEGDRIEKEPFRVVEVLNDALAFGFADVRPEPGRELFFLTRGGAWSYSLEQDGYRGNISRLVESELLYDVPSPQSLSAWKYVLPHAGGDRIILPGRLAYTVWSPASGPEATYAAETVFEYEPDEPVPGQQGPGQRGGSTEIRIGGGGPVIERDDTKLPAPFLPGLVEGNSALLSSGSSFPAPALLDVDGDGRRDLVVSIAGGLAIHLADTDGAYSREPTRVELFPEYLQGKDRNYDLEFHDLNGDVYPDIVARIDQHGSGIGNGVVTLQILIGDKQRLLPEKPRQILRFEAAQLRYEISDINGDGTPDLSLREFKLPSFLETVTGLEFTLTHLLYLGERGRGRPFSRKPAMRQTNTYDENSIQEAIKNRELAMDLDGDGITDMVEVDIQGRIAIRRLRLEKKFFGGQTWSLEETPWRRFEVFGNIERFEVRDLNGDGLGDIISPGEQRLTILLSARGGRR